MSEYFDPTPLPDKASYPVPVRGERARTVRADTKKQHTISRFTNRPWTWVVAAALIMISISPQSIYLFMAKNDHLHEKKDLYVSSVSSLWESLTKDKNGDDSTVSDTDSAPSYSQSEAFKILDEINERLAHLTPRHYELEVINFMPRSGRKNSSTFDSFFNSSFASVSSPLSNVGSKARKFFTWGNLMRASPYALESSNALSDDRLYFGSKQTVQSEPSNDESSSKFSFGGLEEGAGKLLRLGGITQ